MTENKELVVVRVRSSININDKMKNTLQKLQLLRPQMCVIVPSTPVNIGMLKKVQHLVTWGEVDEDTKNRLQPFKITKRVQRKIVSYALHPPLKGYGRKGVKMPFAKGGATGYRGNKINDLVLRMTNGSQQKKEK